MQDIQNIPNPDVDSIVHDDEFGNHSQNDEIRNENDAEQIPLPDDERKPAPIEEPSDVENHPIEDINKRPMQIL